MGFLSDLFGTPSLHHASSSKTFWEKCCWKSPDAVIWLGQMSKILTSPTLTSPMSPFGGPSVMGLTCSGFVCSERISRKRHSAAQNLRSATQPVRVFEVLISGNVLSTEVKLV